MWLVFLHHRRQLNSGLASIARGNFFARELLMNKGTNKCSIAWFPFSASIVESSGTIQLLCFGREGWVTMSGRGHLVSLWFGYVAVTGRFNFLHGNGWLGNDWGNLYFQANQKFAMVERNLLRIKFNFIPLTARFLSRAVISYAKRPGRDFFIDSNFSGFTFLDKFLEALTF